MASTDTAPTVAAPADSTGAVETRALFHQDSDSIHLHLHRLGAGASLNVAGAPADRLIYIWQGAVEAGGRNLAPRSTAIVEYGSALRLTALEPATSVLVFHRRQRGNTLHAGGHVHLLPSERVPRVDNAGGSRTGMALHADAQCATCQVWLHENDFGEAGGEVAVHSHSEDEVIFVRAGSVRLGKRLHGPGTAIAIAANTKYGFMAGPEGLSILNFRGAAPIYVSADGSVVLDEAELWRNTVGPLEYLAPLPVMEHAHE
jgi:hypothetical protein